jgi:integrase
MDFDMVWQETPAKSDEELSAQIEPILKGEITCDNRKISKLEISTTQETALSQAHLDSIAASSKAARASNSKRSYATGWQQFLTWCEQHGRQVLPASPLTVQAWIIDLSKTAKIATIKNRIAAVAVAHRAAGYAFDRKLMVGLVLDGIRRENGSAKKQAKAIVLDDIRAAVNQLPTTLIGLRDRALLLIGFFGVMRRSEIVGLDVNDELTDGATGFVQIVSAGLLIKLVHSKTDKFGDGQEIGLPRAGTIWLAATATSIRSSSISVTPMSSLAPLTG